MSTVRYLQSSSPRGPDGRAASSSIDASRHHRNRSSSGRRHSYLRGSASAEVRAACNIGDRPIVVIRRQLPPLIRRDTASAACFDSVWLLQTEKRIAEVDESPWEAERLQFALAKGRNQGNFRGQQLGHQARRTEREQVHVARRRDPEVGKRPKVRQPPAGDRLWIGRVGRRGTSYGRSRQARRQPAR